MSYENILTKNFLSCLAIFVILIVHAVGSANSLPNSQLSQTALSENREKRNAEIDSTQNENMPINKRYIPYEELQKRLRHYIGKRHDKSQQTNDLSQAAEKRMRYFVGKRGDDVDALSPADIAKRMRYFVGKRSRLRYFVGKRGNDDTASPSEDGMEKRMRYFVGKRGYLPVEGGYLVEEQTIDPAEKRMRYFVGKRKQDDFINGNAFHKRMRYFVGKRDPLEESKNDYEKRMRYFVGKRDNSETSEDDRQYEQKRMRYFVG